jgi:hypothetical protein
MTHVLGFLAFAILPLFGLAVWPAVRNAPWTTRIAVAGVAGSLVVGAVMIAMSALHIQWSRTSVWIALLLIVAATLRRFSLAGAAPPQSHWITAAIVLFVFLSLYGALTARQTSPDLFYFWGSKAVRFFRNGGVTLAFLRAPDSLALHRDYPPFLSVMYAWSQIVAAHYSVWAVLLVTPLALAAIAAIVRGFSGDGMGTLLVVATMAHGMAVGCVGGAAEGPLLLFEALTLVAIVFIDDWRAGTLLGAIGAIGATAMKVEGATFVIAVVLAIVVVKRDLRRAAWIAAPAAAVFLGWLLFTQRTGIAEIQPLLARFPFRFAMIPRVLELLAKPASYGIWGVSWLIPIVLIILGRLRPAALPLAIAALTLAVTIFFYSRGTDPWWWITVSADRVLLTPLLALDIAAVAAWREAKARAVPRE